MNLADSADDAADVAKGADKIADTTKISPELADAARASIKNVNDLKKLLKHPENFTESALNHIFLWKPGWWLSL